MSGAVVHYSTNRNDLASWTSTLAFTNVGEYVVYFAVDAAKTVREQGNYVVTFVPGTLFIDETSRVGSLWIVDHEDCDAENVYLAFKPTLSSGEMSAETVVGLAEAGKIKVAYATDEESLKMAVPTEVELRDSTGELDIDKGWIWVKVPVDINNLEFGPILWKVTIDR